MPLVGIYQVVHALSVVLIVKDVPIQQVYANNVQQDIHLLQEIIAVGWTAVL